MFKVVSARFAEAFPVLGYPFALYHCCCPWTQLMKVGFAVKQLCYLLDSVTSSLDGQGCGYLWFSQQYFKIMQHPRFMDTIDYVIAIASVSMLNCKTNIIIIAWSITSMCVLYAGYCKYHT